MLEWNVYYEDFNNKRIDIFNVFDHGRFYDDVVKLIHRHPTKKEFSEELKTSARYFFWSKCEWEILITAWVPNNRFDDMKVDIFNQLTLNWDAFVNYIWENISELHDS